MASFTPRLSPRPEPQSTPVVLKNRVLSMLPTCIFFTGMVYIVDPMFRSLRGKFPSDNLFFAAMTLIIHSSLYWGLNGFVFYLQKKGMLDKYQIKRSVQTELPSAELIRQTIVENIPSHLVIQPLTAGYLLYPGLKSNGGDFDKPIPGPLSVFTIFMISWLTLDFLFYWAHRAFHHEKLYKFHKQHHIYKAPIAFAAEYAHPLEQIIANTLPTIAGPIILGMHGNMWFVWLVWRLLETYSAHSGLLISPFNMCLGFNDHTTAYAQYHDFHHTHNLGNFSADWTDHIFGTQDAWLKHIADNNMIPDKETDKKK